MPRIGKTRACRGVVECNLSRRERWRPEAIRPGDVEERADQFRRGQRLIAARRQLDIALTPHRDRVAVAEAAQREPGVYGFGGLVDQVDTEAVQPLVGE